MSWNTLRGGLAAVIALAAGGASADVTARQVWDDMRGYLEGMGYSVTASDSAAGDTLTVRDISLARTLPDDEGSVDVTVPEIRFTENGDGTVSIRYPETLPVAISARPEDEPPADFRLDLTQSGLEIVVSGDPEDSLRYDYGAAQLGIALADLVVDGQPVPPGDARAALTVTGLDGTATVGSGPLRAIEQSASMERLDYDVDFVDPEGDDGRVTLKGSMTALESRTSARIPERADLDDMAAALDEGYALESSLSYSGGQADFSAEEDGQTLTGSTRATQGGVALAIDAERLSYDLTGEGTDVTLEGDELPFPVSFQMARTVMSFVVPLTPSDEPRAFSLGLTLGDFTMSDNLWNIFDPGAMLPRDPATLSLDVDGLARVLVNVFDPDVMESADEPAQLEALTLNSLELRAAGAELTGEGAFTFDNSDTATFNGMPHPTGSIDLRLAGANALLDTLVSMGLLPEEQAMGARMMMSMFAVPAGDDVLRSNIAINGEGQILANGQRIQ
ncbi:DUF2125 domain-containing protein [Rhodosalinus sp. FB01]|uniref:DUF2125 domain-containing protein n=1 Tax=Rhodosalinus sp. FB01 TaxID=3239194 RepID=UPI003524281A